MNMNFGRPPLTTDNSVITDGQHEGKGADGWGTENVKPTRPRRGGITITFPQKLHSLLCKIEKNDELSTIVSWHLDGRSFVIHNPTRFVDEILPRYFRQTKFASFQRQLNAYHFSRLTGDPNAFRHDLFIRDEPDLCRQIKRAPTARGPGPTRIGYLLEEIRRSTYKQNRQRNETTLKVGPPPKGQRDFSAYLGTAFSHTVNSPSKEEVCRPQSTVADIFWAQQTPHVQKSSDKCGSSNGSFWEDFDLDSAANQVLQTEKVAHQGESRKLSDEFWRVLLQNWDPQTEEMSETPRRMDQTLGDAAAVAARGDESESEGFYFAFNSPI